MVTRRLAILGRLSYPTDAALADRSAGFPAAYSSCLSPSYPIPASRLAEVGK